MSNNLNKIREQALKLAKQDKLAEPNIQSVYWFPDENEIRIIELEKEFIASGSGSVEPYYFSPSLDEGITLPSGIAVIRSDEFRQLHLPKNWGTWDKAEELEI